MAAQSGSIEVTPGFVPDEVNGETITWSKIVQLVSDQVLRIAEEAVTAREIEDGSITADKLAETISAQIGVQNGSVSLAKLAAGFMLPISLGGTGASTAATARSGLGLLSNNIVQVVKTDTQSLSNDAAWTDITGLEVSFTPLSAFSKVLVRAIVNCSDVGSGGPVFFRLLRDGAAIGVADIDGSKDRAGFMAATTEGREVSCSAQEFIDSPATTSATVYKVQMRMVNTTYTCAINRYVSEADDATYARVVSSLTVQEIPV